VLTYEITELTPPPDAATPQGVTWAPAVNSNGGAVGGAWQNKGAAGEAVLWSRPDAPQVLEPIPPGGFGIGINDGGDVVGVCDLPNPALNRKSNFSAFIFHGQSGTLENLAEIVGGEASYATGISDDGVVVGFAGDNYLLSRPFNSINIHGFMYDMNKAALTTIDPLRGHSMVFAVAINNLGHVVGTSMGNFPSSAHLFIYRDGRREDLGPGYSVADINDADVITGERTFSSSFPTPSAYRYDAAAANPSFEDLGAMLPPGFAGSHGSAINNDGTIVGFAYDANSEDRAMIYQPDGPDAGWTDLNDALVDKDGWIVQRAEGISDSGHIVGAGLHHGLRRAFLLRPHTPDLRLQDKIAQAIWVLIRMIGGGTVDAPGGIGITGGGKPVPIGPQEFAGVWRSLSRDERDAYIGMAIRNLGAIVADVPSRAEIERVATRLMQGGLGM
jgi:probable HAF family extracellular repeat protein